MASYHMATAAERRDPNSEFNAPMRITLHAPEQRLLKSVGVSIDLNAPHPRGEWIAVAGDVYFAAEDYSASKEDRLKEVAGVIEALADRGYDQPFRSLPAWARSTPARKPYRPSPDERGSQAKAGGDATGIGYVFDDAGQAAADLNGRGICVLRAISIVTGEALSDVIAECKRVARDLDIKWTPSGGTHRRISERLHEHYGLERQALPARKPTLAEAHAEYGDCICHIANHHTACVGGANRDTWDCRLTGGGRNYRVKAVWARRAS